VKRRGLTGLALLALLGLAACQRFSERDFVGDWQSSRAVTPLHLAANGEWELRQADGSVLQYGLWRVEGKTLVWSVRQGERVIDDPTPVLKVKRDTFSVRERDGATTVFRRLP